MAIKGHLGKNLLGQSSTWAKVSLGNGLLGQCSPWAKGVWAKGAWAKGAWAKGAWAKVAAPENLLLLDLYNFTAVSCKVTSHRKFSAN